jgi:antitoxin HicB
VIDAQRYPAQVFYSDEDEGFIAVATDLPGCSAFGDTQEEAVTELRSAIAAWQIAASKAGNPIPEPSKPQLDDLPSGKILLRLPRSLHAQLIEKAKQDNVSLNQHLVMVLTASTAAHYIRTVVAEQMESINKWWEQTLFVHRALDVSRTMRIFSSRTEATRWAQDRPQIFLSGVTVTGVTKTAEVVNG